LLYIQVLGGVYAGAGAGGAGRVHMIRTMLCAQHRLPMGGGPGEPWRCKTPASTWARGFGGAAGGR
jgi:hypothetical protein